MVNSEQKEEDSRKVFDGLSYRGAATQKVKSFVLQEARRLNDSKPWRLPPMRKLAEHLGVSVATVQSAYRQLGEEGIVRNDPNRASYVTPSPVRSAPRVYHIGIDFLKGDENLNRSWRGNLHGGMLQEIVSGGNRVVFHQIPQENLSREDLKAEGAEDGMDGVILVMRENVQRWPELNAGIPAVFRHPLDMSITANFVSADIFGAAKLCGRAFSAAGRQRPFMAAHFNLDDASISWAYAGLAAGYREDVIGSHSIGIVHFGSDASEEPATLKKAFENPQTAPDAIYCCSDYTAMKVLKILETMEVRVPEEVSVVGSTGLILMNTEFFTMTRAFQPLPEIGAELVRRLVKAIEEGDAHREFPGIFLPCKFAGGATTLPAENKVLDILAFSKAEGLPE